MFFSLFNFSIKDDIWIDIIYQPPPYYAECKLITSTVGYSVYNRKFKPRSRSPPNN